MTSPNLSAVRDVGPDSYIRANYPGVEYGTALIAGADSVFSSPQIIPLSIPESNVLDISGINLYNIEIMRIQIDLTVLPSRSPSGIVVPTVQVLFEPFVSRFDFGDSIIGKLKQNNVWYTRATSKETISLPTFIAVFYSAASMEPTPLPADTDYFVDATMNVQISGKIRQKLELPGTSRQGDQ